MLNPERKKQFLESGTGITNSDYNFSTALRVLGKYEDELQKDFCEMNIGEAQQVTDAIVSRPGGNTLKWAAIQLLRDYTTWCFSSGKYVVNNGFILAKMPPVEKIGDRYFSSPEDLQAVMDLIFDNVDSNTIHLVYRARLWLSFAGIYEDGIENIKVSDVDLENMSIHFNHIDYPIYDESVSVFKKLIELDKFTVIRTNYTADMPRIQSSHLLRGIKSEYCSETAKWQTDTLCKKAKKDGKTSRNFAYGRVFTSGLYYKTYIAQKRGMRLSFQEAIVREYERIGMDQEGMERNIWLMSKTHIENYYKWKAVFGL